MVLMGMGDDDAQQVGALLDDVAQIGQHDIDARHIGAREGQAAIDQDPLAPPLRTEAVEGGVHADLAKAAEWNENELVLGARHCGSCRAWSGA